MMLTFLDALCATLASEEKASCRSERCGNDSIAGEHDAGLSGATPLGGATAASPRVVHRSLIELC